MTGEVEGKVAVVTGGGRGIGRATAVAMAEHGAAVVVADIFRDEAGSAAADEVVQEITAAGGRAVASGEDVASSSGAAKIMELAVSTFGRLDIAVLCAGNFITAPFLELSEHQLEASLAVHIKGHFFCAQSAVSHMRRQGAGRIITVGSRAAFSTPVAAYAAAKAGVMGLTAALALELRGDNITVNCLIPKAQTQLFPSTNQRPIGGLPISRNLDASYIAPLLVYLSSAEAANITGKFFYASGGEVGLYPDPFTFRGASAILSTSDRWSPGTIGTLMQPIIGDAAAS